MQTNTHISLTLDRVVLNMDSFRMTDAEFYAFCQDNKELKIERDAQQNIIVMPPTGIRTEWSNTDLIGKLYVWNSQHQLGEIFGNNGGFRLPNGAVRVPDAAWIPREKWETFSQTQTEGFLPLCPDFVVEIRSKSDPLSPLKQKMEEWMESGCLLAWLIDPVDQQVVIYRKNRTREELPGLDHVLSGEYVLPEFELDLKTWKN